MLEREYVSKKTAALARRLEDWLVTTQFVQFASVAVLPGREPKLDVLVGVERRAPEGPLADALQVLILNQLMEWEEDDRVTVAVRARRGVPRPGPQAAESPEHRDVS